MYVRLFFSLQCMKAYAEFEIAEGAYDISCPDAQCPSQGVLLMTEVERLVGPKLVEKHRKYRLNRGKLHKNLCAFKWLSLKKSSFTLLNIFTF